MGYANRNSVAASRKMSPTPWMIGACSRCLTFKTSRSLRLHSRRSRIFPKTSSINSSTSLGLITGGLELRRGRMNSCGDFSKIIGSATRWSHRFYDVQITEILFLLVDDLMDNSATSMIRIVGRPLSKKRTFVD